MFIPVNAKADVSGSKKGKLTPAQNAQVNAWCLASKTGILDCLNKCEATQSSYDVTDYSANVIFKSGYVVICGRLVECEAGTTVTLEAPTVDNETGWIVLKYDLSASGNSEFAVVQHKSTDGELIQQDLNDNPLTAVYEFPLYSYTINSSTVVLTRTDEYVPDIGGKLTQFITALTGTGLTGDGEPPLQAYDTTKGTIEERLTALGFNSGSISSVLNPLTINTSNTFSYTAPDGSTINLYTDNYFIKIGKYVMCEIVMQVTNFSAGTLVTSSGSSTGNITIGSDGTIKCDKALIGSVASQGGTSYRKYIDANTSFATIPQGFRPNQNIILNDMSIVQTSSSTTATIVLPYIKITYFWKTN